MKETILEFLAAGSAHVPFRDILTNLDINIRHKHPGPRIATIWEELEHMRIAQEDIVQYMISPDWKSPVWPDGYWPDIQENISDTVWQNTSKRFFNDLQTAVDLLKNEALVLTDHIPHAPQHTYLREFMLIIDHNAYHAGKIILIRKYFNDWPG